MEAAFNRPTCGYYSGEGKHGGPDPNPELRPGGNPRRPTDRKRRSDGDEDGFIDEFSGELLRYNKKQPLVGIKQITTGYRKWAERYINECWGQRKHKYQVNRMNKWFEILGAHFMATQA